MKHITHTSKLMLILLCIYLLPGCAARVINISGSFPTPLARTLPINLGVYYDTDFINHSYIEINDENGKDQYIVNSGASQVELFNSILPAVFTEVIVIDDINSLSQYSQLDAVFVPVIDEFQLGLPAKTKLDVYEIWLKYNMRLSTLEGEYIADWIMTAYGKAPKESFQSVHDGINDAASVALRDLAASFTLGFDKIPEINEWLKREGLRNE